MIGFSFLTPEIYFRKMLIVKTVKLHQFLIMRKNLIKCKDFMIPKKILDIPFLIFYIIKNKTKKVGYVNV